MEKVIKRRTITKAYKEYKNLDPETCITETTIRHLVRDKKIDFIMHGNRPLIDFDDLVDYFNGRKAM